MSGLHLHRSNRLEALADALAAILSVPADGVLAAETVVVQSLGMRRWIQLGLAQRAGVAMNVRFPFPAGFADEVLRAALPEEPATSAFSREVLPWRVLGLFPELLARPAFAELRGYAEGEPRALKTFQLAQKVAAVFDRYIAYRPEWLLDWQKGREDHWQAQLWRELVRGHERTNPPTLAARLVERLRRGAVPPGRLPARLCVFGISSLPPVYIELLKVVATAAEVHLFLLEPTADYWAELLTPREREREARRRRLRELPEEEEPELPGNALLASLGKTGRDFSWLLLDRLDALGEADAFVPPTEDTMLGQLQGDLFHLREPESPRAVSPEDRSLQVHCCHGPMRELEVLHDQLLALFATQPDLAPRDILVTMPDVETYAPFITAVFGAPESEAVRIPYSIADRAARAENSVAAALLQVLDLAGGRFPAPAVLALLDTPAVRSRFGIAEADLPRLRDWVERSGIRWGIDAEHRASFDLPAFAQNSWRAGLDRLLLGYALPGDRATLFAGVLPEPGIEGQLALVLGQFADFAERLFAQAATLAAPRPPAAWERRLRGLLEELFDQDDDFADEIRRVSLALESLGETAAAAGFEAPVEFAVIRAHLATALADQESGGGFLAGRVTFCALKPMRSIPFRVICMLGLNDDAFPRRDRPLPFDLIPRNPRRGDRSLREDDRYLFLETLFSARETLHLSYSGLSARDNAEAPPSVLVAELLDTLARHWNLPKDFVLKHKLQPFSAAYFTGENARLFSYSADNAAAARRGALARTASPPFAAEPLPPPDAEARELSPEQLGDFLAHPARTFLQKRLRLSLPDSEEPAAEREPETLPTLTRHRLREALTLRSIGAHALAADLATARGGGELPPGYAGASAYGEIAGEVETLLARLGGALEEAPLPPLPFELACGEWRLRGVLAGVRPAGLIRFRAAKQKPADLLRAWVAHLALQLTDAPPEARTTVVHSTDASVRFGPVADAAARLAELLELCARGLCAPLPFFPAASREFAARKLGVKGGPTYALDAARKEWRNTESADRWNALAFRGVDDPLAGDFAEVALAVWQPLFAAREEME
jgi:exodeoxyribonuclease V gamma subunit